MIALIRFVLGVLISPFRSKSRLEAENAVLRHQLIVLRRKIRGRPQLTNNDRCPSLAAGLVQPLRGSRPSTRPSAAGTREALGYRSCISVRHQFMPTTFF